MSFIQNKCARRTCNWMVAASALAVLGACQPEEKKAAPEIRPVRVVTVESVNSSDSVMLTGRVQAESEVNLAFRIDGRMISRAVSVGDAVRAGQEIARLNPENEENGLRASEAALQGARGQLIEARANETRNRSLLAQNFISQAAFDRIAQVANSAQTQVDAAQAQVSITRNRLGYTRLLADAGGVVIAVGAEPGEVVQGGRMVVQIARKDGRDAVFDVSARLKDIAPANPEITVTLASDATVTAKGRVREVSPRADPVTGTFAVRVGLIEPPVAMRLGATVTGSMQVGAAQGIGIPASALVRAEDRSAVWVVDPQALTVSLRTIEVRASDPAKVQVATGLDPGEIVVTAGVQALRPGQKVRLLETKP
ncbi:MAG: efflux RND transporter periplasmic adaptor subunit [Dechloromonas sp.]|nr:efflux RND transporter periplasmic adaptor subunit [Candidatus Dechloromonas phosphoritropha]MBP8788072.1 efflux RND transporter periplasmic adaptor subunit [Azonexus sp.]MBP9228566.1 efflux RND transporter periplasmic adaptor subunit [Azonexus sp.]